MKILSFGEILWDVYPQQSYLGGAPLNFAVHATKSGAEAFLLSAVGTDELGEQTKNSLRKLGVHDSFLQCSKKQTGKCLVTLDEQAVPSYELLQDVAYDDIAFPNGFLDYSFDALTFGTLALRSPKNREALRAVIRANVCKRVYCDLNLRAPFYDDETILFCLQTADVLKVSEDELQHLKTLCRMNGETQEALVAQLTEKFKNLQTFLVTLGENGSFAYERRTGQFTYQAAVKTKVCSTVGAGDSFGAAFLVPYLRGEPIQNCLQKGAERSAEVVSKAGAF